MKYCKRELRSMDVMVFGISVCLFVGKCVCLRMVKIVCDARTDG